MSEITVGSKMAFAMTMNSTDKGHVGVAGDGRIAIPLERLENAGVYLCEIVSMSEKAIRVKPLSGPLTPITRKITLQAMRNMMKAGEVVSAWIQERRKGDGRVLTGTYKLFALPK